MALAEAFAGYGLWRQQSYLSAGGLTEFLGFQGAVTVDGFSIFFNWIFLIAALIVAIVSYKYLEIAGEHHGEYYALILFAQAGMYFLASGTDLVTLFIGLELMALCFYVMVGFLRGDKRSNEAALKYLLLGAFSTGFLAYGFSLHVRPGRLHQARRRPGRAFAAHPVGPGRLPRHGDHRHRTPLQDLRRALPHVGAGRLRRRADHRHRLPLGRLQSRVDRVPAPHLPGPLAASREAWEPLLSIVAIATLTLGNLAAINQTNIKRLLAYSSISHAGYMLLGLIAGNDTGINGIAVYVMVYTFMNLGAFLVIVALRRQGIIGEDLDDIAGLMHKSPGYAVLMLIFLLSLAGIPPTAGFLGKYYIFLSLIQTRHYALAVVATLYVAVAIYYYFKIVRSMFIREATEKAPLASSLGLRVAVYASGLLTLAIGVYPEPFLRLAQTSLFDAIRTSMDADPSSSVVHADPGDAGDHRAVPAGGGIHRAGGAQSARRFPGAARPHARRSARAAATARGCAEADAEGRHHPDRLRPGDLLVRAGHFDLHRPDRLLRPPVHRRPLRWPTSTSVCW